MLIKAIFDFLKPIQGGKGQDFARNQADPGTLSAWRSMRYNDYSLDTVGTAAATRSRAQADYSYARAKRNLN
jgi:hypothetical protein